MERKRLDGRLTITKRSGGGEPYVCIAVKDDLSRKDICKVEISMEEFAQALFSLAECPCQVEVGDLSVLGKKKEVKTVAVRVKTATANQDPAAVRAALAEHEVDGWQGADADAMNSHRISGYDAEGYVARVTFVRWVDVEG